jgi:hypothetical protein
MKNAKDIILETIEKTFVNRMALGYVKPKSVAYKKARVEFFTYRRVASNS